MGKITLFVRNCKVQGRFSNDIIIEQNRTVYSFLRKHEKQ